MREIGDVALDGQIHRPDFRLFLILLRLFGRRLSLAFCKIDKREEGSQEEWEEGRKDGEKEEKE